MVVVVAGHDLLSRGDEGGRLADVAEVLPGRDLSVGNAVMRHQGGPGVQTDEVQVALGGVMDDKGVDRENAEDVVHFGLGEVAAKLAGLEDEVGDLLAVLAGSVVQILPVVH